MEGKTLKGYLDDTVQIVGLTLCCIPDREFTGRQAKRLEAALLGRSAVLLKDNGRHLVWEKRRMTRGLWLLYWEKGCQAALLAERTEGVKTRQPGPRLAGADDLPEKIFKTEIEQAGGEAEGMKETSPVRLALLFAGGRKRNGLCAGV